MMGQAWAHQGPWEDYFTVVQWEQRGVGKNPVDADTIALAQTMSVERMVTDAESVVAQLRMRFGREKIVVIGFSFGSEIGMRLIKRRPEWVSAYVGVGQLAAGDIETVVYRRVTEIARQRRDDSTFKALHKRFITFERSAHYPMFEESGRFLVTLVNEELPLTAERASFPVLP